MLDTLAKAIDVLKASGWQALMIAAACGVLIYLSTSGTLPAMEPGWLLLAWAVLLVTLGLAIAALISWLHGLIVAEVKPHPHDIALAKKVRATFDIRLRNFLRYHDFGVVFAYKSAAPIFEIADSWVGSDYRFQDRRLNKAMTELIRLTRDLGEKIAMKSGPVRNHGGEHMQAVPTDEERGSDTFSEHTVKAVAELNALATETLNAYEKLDGLMRVRVSSVYEEQPSHLMLG
jgi:hypothetical protein